MRGGGRGSPSAASLARPAVPAAVWLEAAFIAGVAVTAAVVDPPACVRGVPGWVGLAVASAAIVLAAAAQRRRRLSAPMLALLLLGVALGGGIYSAAALLSVERTGAAIAAGQHVGSGPSFSGEIVSDPVPGTAGDSFQVRLDDSGALFRLSIRAPHEPLWLGQRIEWTGSAIALDPRSPKDQPWLLAGECARGFTDGSSLAAHDPTGWRGALLSWRQRCLARWSASDTSPAQGLVSAIALGDRGGIDEITKADFTRSGLAHALAASGTYAAVLAMLATWALREMGLRARWRRPAAVGILAAYALVTGMQTSVLRGTLCFAAAAGAWLLGRRTSPLATIALAATLLAIASPFIVFSVGFRFSFVAVLAMALWAAPIEARLTSLPSPTRRPAAIALAVQGGLVPLLALDMGQVSIVAPVANLVAWPILTPLLTAGMAAAALGGFEGGLAAAATIILAAARFCAAALARAAGAFSAPAWAAVPATGFPLLLAPAWWIGIEALLRTRFGLAASRPLWGRAGGDSRPESPGLAARSGPRVEPAGPREAAARLRRRRWAAASVILLVALWSARPALAPPATGLEIRFLDVGQGDSILLRTAAGHSVLVDGGPSGSLAGRRWAEAGVTRLDLVVVTHPHTDHYVGLEAVLAQLPVGEMWQSPLAVADAASDPGYAHLLELARRRSVRLRAPPAGAVARIDPWLTLQVLAPGDERVTGSSSDANNDSLVVMATCGRVKTLLSGDIQQERQVSLQQIVGAGSLACTVYKVAHHGSRYSLDSGFLDALRARVAVISVGQANRYGHPSPRTIEALALRGMRVLRTDRDGTVIVTTDGRRVWIQPERALPGF